MKNVTFLQITQNIEKLYTIGKHFSLQVRIRDCYLKISPCLALIYLQSFDYTEKRANFFGNFHRVKWVLPKRAWNKDPKNAHFDQSYGRDHWRIAREGHNLPWPTRHHCSSSDSTTTKWGLLTGRKPVSRQVYFGDIWMTINHGLHGWRKKGKKKKKKTR